MYQVSIGMQAGVGFDSRAVSVRMRMPVQVGWRPNRLTREEGSDVVRLFTVHLLAQG